MELVPAFYRQREGRERKMQVGRSKTVGCSQLAFSLSKNLTCIDLKIAHFENIEPFRVCYLEV